MKILIELTAILTAATLLSSCSNDQPSVTAAAATIYSCPYPAEIKISNNTYTVNTKHIFCGQVTKSNEAEGFHSAPGGINPTTVKATTKAQIPGSTDIYKYKNFGVRNDDKSPWVTKLASTIFPDTCTGDQVIASIEYATSMMITCSDKNNPNEQCGRSAPFKNTSGNYCTSVSSGGSFNLRVILSANNKKYIISAYPDY
ncbi:EndoU domain-containing protein [Pseudomonas protegens]|uniref:EndoU domain-containing protein n=1 Tax=Pseudomonas protegens TaxID=380021 RepID=UPI00320902E9